MDKLIQNTDMQVVSKAIQAVLLQVDYLSDCGLDVCLAVAAPKRVQFWASRTWRDDLTDAMKKAANHQADLNEDNGNIDMFVERKSTQAAEKHHLVDQDTQSDAFPAPVTPPHHIVRGQQTVETWALDEITIKSEPAEVYQIITEAENSSCSDGDGSHQTTVHPRYTNSVVDEQSYVLEEVNIVAEPADVVLVKTAEDHDSNEINVWDKQLNTVASSSCPLQTTEGVGTAKKYRCTECQYRTNESGNIRRHMATHTPDDTRIKKYKCTECPYSSADNSNLKRHMRRHTGEKPYRCKLCNYKATHLTSLRYHIRKHTGKTLDCELCDYKAVAKYALLEHMRKHTGDSFNCEHCEYKTTRKDSLDVHVRKHTGETLNCEHCEYTSNHKSKMLEHIKRRHPALSL